MGFLDDIVALGEELVKVARDPSDDALKNLGKKFAESVGIATDKSEPKAATGTDGQPAPAAKQPPTLKLV